MVAAADVERVDTDPSLVEGWLDRSLGDLRLVREVLVERDKDRAMSIAYEAGYRACAGILALEGYRVRSVQGHHRIALEAAGHLMPDARARLRRLDAARRFRNDNLYGRLRPATERELGTLIADVDALLAGLRSRLEQQR